jgi:hypothetical protein
MYYDHPDFDSFIRWERASRDAIDFKKIYVDLTEDLTSGLLLSQIIYWHLPDQDGCTRLRVEKKGELWLVKRRYEWWDETRLSPRQVDRALGILRAKNIIITEIHRFYGEPSIHIQLCLDSFLDQLNEIIDNPPPNPFLPECQKPISLQGENEVAKRGNSLTEITSKSTSEKSICKGAKERPLFSSLFWQNLSAKERNALLNYEAQSHNTLEDAFEYTLERMKKGGNIQNPVGYVVDLLRFNKDLTGDSEAWAEYGKEKHYG